MSSCSGNGFSQSSGELVSTPIKWKDFYYYLIKAIITKGNFEKSYIYPHNY